MSKLPIRNMKGEAVGEYDLSDDLLVYDKGLQAMHDAIVAYQAHQHPKTASTLTKGEVAGSNRKPWKQKGMGRARAGYRQSPVWRGGGVTFGPKPRVVRKKVSKKAGKLAFRRALSERVAEGSVIVLDAMNFSKPKTSEMMAVLKALEVQKSAVFVVGVMDSNVELAVRNVPKVDAVLAESINTYQMLRYSSVIVTKKGMAALEERLKAAVGRGE